MSAIYRAKAKSCFGDWVLVSVRSGVPNHNHTCCFYWRDPENKIAAPCADQYGWPELNRLNASNLEDRVYKTPLTTKSHPRRIVTTGEGSFTSKALVKY